VLAGKVIHHPRNKSATKSALIINPKTAKALSWPFCNQCYCAPTELLRNRPTTDWRAVASRDNRQSARIADLRGFSRAARRTAREPTAEFHSFLADRIDATMSLDRSNPQIEAGITRSAFVVADLAEASPNVLRGRVREGLREASDSDCRKGNAAALRPSGRPGSLLGEPARRKNCARVEQTCRRALGARICSPRPLPHPHRTMLDGIGALVPEELSCCRLPDLPFS